MNWLQFSAIAAALVACALAYLLIRDWRAERAYRRLLTQMSEETERVILHGENPWVSK